jgi:TRAP-type mannitol/chloroaromatic compound transport system substrate-binding protein
VPARRPAQSNASRRKFLGAAATATAAIAGFPMIAVAQTPAVLRFQGAWSARDTFHEYALDYAKKFNEMSGGRARIEVLAAGAVVKPQELLAAVEKGVLDGCHAVPALWAGKDISFSLFGSGPALGMDANLLLSWMEYGGGRTLYEELYTRTLNANVTGFLYGPMPAQSLGWFRKPIASAAQLKGLRMHAAALPGDLFRQMDAAARELAQDEIVPAARSGTIDAAAFSNPASDSALGLPEALPVCMLQSYHQPAQVFEVLFSKRRFESLPPDLRGIARYAAQAASADMSWKAVDRYSAEHARLRGKARLLKTPPEVLRAQLKAWSVLAARRSRDNPVYERILKSQQVWARRTVGWALDIAADPRMAYDHWFAGPAAAGDTSKP